jgi:hypothetical protein
MSVALEYQYPSFPIRRTPNLAAATSAKVSLVTAGDVTVVDTDRAFPKSCKLVREKVVTWSAARSLRLSFSPDRVACGGMAFRNVSMSKNHDFERVPSMYSLGEGVVLPYLSIMLTVPDILDRLPIIGTWRRRALFIDAEAISLIREARDNETAYQTARNLMRLARARGDREATALYSRVAVRIADVTGRRIGKGGPEPRYGIPSREIDGEVTRPRR